MTTVNRVPPPRKPGTKYSRRRVGLVLGAAVLSLYVGSYVYARTRACPPMILSLGISGGREDGPRTFYVIDLNQITWQYTSWRTALFRPCIFVEERVREWDAGSPFRWRWGFP